MSKNRDTDIHLRGESHARRRFLSIYLFLVILLLAIVDFYYYRSQEQLMLANQRIKMMEFATTQSRKLKQLHRHFPHDTLYPRNSHFESAIYDLEYQKIFSTLKEPTVHLDQDVYHIGKHFHLVKILSDYYLGAKYLIIEVAEDRDWYGAMYKKMILWTLPLLLLLLGIGIYLSKLFVRPMSNSIMLLDRFIKDTTHELNTPISAILANMEMIDQDSITESNSKKFIRIAIAAKTISTLYEDLKFGLLESNKKTNDEEIELEELVANRLEYFDLLMESKKIELIQSLGPSTIYADKKLIARIIDNLLSNAIKYNKRGGKIEVVLDQGILSIEDSGIGMSEEQIAKVFDRYSRFSTFEGGFGIGLNIVKQIAERYNIQIDIDSTPKVGTKITLRWQR